MRLETWRPGDLETWRGPNRVALENGAVWITTGPRLRLTPAKSLENWLRKQARERIAHELEQVTKKANRVPSRVHIMDQRTKWGSCSGLGNLSFNWRLIMAPDEVLRDIVSHEVTHLAIPDHSRTFWLMLRSLHPRTDWARQWLVAHGARLMTRLSDVVVLDSP